MLTYRTFRTIEMLEQQEREEAVLPTVPILLQSAETCAHPPEMVDDANTCCACGAYVGHHFVAANDKTMFSVCGATHTLSSAAASAAARKKRREISQNTAQTTIYFELPSGVVVSAKKKDVDFKAKKPEKRVEVEPSESGSTQWESFSSAPHFTCEVVKLRALPTGDELDSLFAGLAAVRAERGWDRSPARAQRRAAIIATMVAEFMKEPARAKLPASLYGYLDAVPCNSKNLPSALDDELVRQFCHEAYGAVVSHDEYFNSPQRRRLHHLSLFVAMAMAHVKVFHAGAPREEIEECLEIDRIRAKCKPSQWRFCKRAMVAALSDALQITYTCTTRLVQEAFDMVSEPADSLTSHQIDSRS